MEGRKLKTLMSSLRDLIFFFNFTILDQNHQLGWHGTSSRQEQLIPEDAISPTLTQAEMPCLGSANTCHHPPFWAAPVTRENLFFLLLFSSFWAQIGCVWTLKEISAAVAFWIPALFIVIRDTFPSRRPGVISPRGRDQTPWKPQNSYLSETSHLHPSFQTGWQIGKSCESFDTWLQPWTSFIHTSPGRLGF